MTATRRWARLLPQGIVELLFEHDLFLSYSNKCSALYTARLADELRARGLSVFLDATEFPAGGSLPTETERAVRTSSALVLVYGGVVTGTMEGRVAVWPLERREVDAARRVRVLPPR